MRKESHFADALARVLPMAEANHRLQAGSYRLQEITFAQSWLALD
jgi:hypothetical protein